MSAEPSNPDPIPAPLEAAAAGWLARRDRGLTGAEQDEYLQWLRADPRHRLALAHLEKTWQALDALAGWRPAHAAQPNPDLLAPPRRRSWPGFSFLVPLVLAATAVALAYVVWWSGPPAVAPLAVQHYATALGAQRHVTLPDGSTVGLNTDSAIAVHAFTGERRIDLLRGEAHFTVARDPARPFRVYAGGFAVRDLSTAFSVRLRSGAIDVLVTQGSVQLESPNVEDAHLPRLTAPQRALVPLHGTGANAVVTTLGPEQLQRALAWREGWLKFSETPLAEAVAEFNRYNRRTLRLGDESLADLRIGGSFRADNASAFVRLLEASFHVDAEPQGETETVLRRARQP